MLHAVAWFSAEFYFSIISSHCSAFPKQSYRGRGGQSTDIVAMAPSPPSTRNKGSAHVTSAA